MSSYKALYRKYRPQSFEEVVDQEYVTRTLQNAIKNDRISHAYLFNGPRGIGKTSIARIFAKAINCEHGKNGEPCGKCEICESIMEGSNPDIIEIDAASRTKVEQMRETLEKVTYLPSMCKKKVYIIDEVHMLSTASFNALLKTLEEPPKHVIFILCTTEVEKVIPTIRSRCQRFDFHLISKPAMVERLRYISDVENIKISNEALSVVADMSEGGMRDSLSLLDQISSFSLNDEITADDVLQVSGGVSVKSLTDMAKAIKDNDSSLAISLIDEFLRQGKETDKIVQGLVTFFKDILVMKNTGRVIERVGYDTPEFKELKETFTNRRLFSNIDALTDCMNDSRFSTSKRIYLELALIKMCDNQGIMENISYNAPVNNVVQPQIQRPKEVKVEDGYDATKVYTPNFNKPEDEPKPLERKPEEITINVPVQNVQEPIKEEPKVEVQERIVENTVQSENEPLVSSSTEIKETVETKEVEEKEIVGVKKDEPLTTEVDEFAFEEMIPTPGIEYDIHFVERVLNNADIPFKRKLIEFVDAASLKTETIEDKKCAALLSGSKIEASTRNEFIISFQSVGQCNLVMKEENKKNISKFIFKFTGAKLNFLALTQSTFSEITNDFIAKYRTNKQANIAEPISLEPKACPGLRINFKPVIERDEDKYKDIQNALGDLFVIKE